MATSFPQRPDSIDIPERPTVSTSRSSRSDLGGDRERSSGWSRRRRILIAGGIAATGLVVVLAALLLFGGHRGTVNPGDAPLIKAEDRPFKVTPESRGGMEVPNRDILVYERLQAKPGSKPPVERLLPEPEQPLSPPAPRPHEEATAPEPLQMPPEDEDVQPEADRGSPPASIAPSESVPAPLPPVIPAPDRAAAEKAAQQKAAAEKAAAEKAAQRKAAAEKAAQQKAAADKAAAQKAAAEKLARAEPASAPASGSYQVQLYSGRSADDAKGAWSQLKGKNADLLASLSPMVARADLGERGTFYRLRAGPLSEAQAKTLCQSLSGRGTACIIVRPGS